MSGCDDPYDVGILRQHFCAYAFFTLQVLALGLFTLRCILRRPVAGAMAPHFETADALTGGGVIAILRGEIE